MPNPIYSNIVGIRMSEAELVLDFGCIVPTTPDPSTPQAPVEFDPIVRVIMAINGIHNFADMLNRAATAYAERVKQGHSAMGAVWIDEGTQKTASQR